MSTTVNYKNNVLTTIGYGSSATLNTQGTWLEDDIDIEVDSLNLQSKTVTPNTNQQIILPDNYQSVTKTDSNIVGTYTAIGYFYTNLDQIDTSIKQAKYIRLNGSVSIGYGSYLFWKITFTNAIIGPINNPNITANYTINNNDYTITKIGNHNMNSISSIKYYTKLSMLNQGYIYAIIYFDNDDFQYDHIITVFDNFTIDWSTTSNSFVNYDALEQVTVNAISAQSKSVIPNDNEQIISPDVNYDYLSQVTVAPIPSEYIIPSGTLSITNNGTYDVTNYENTDVNITSITQAIAVTDTIDPVNGGTIRNINAIDISDTTATANDVASGKYFYTADGTKTTGTKISDETYSDTVNAILTRTISGSYENSEITNIGHYAFAYCINLTSVNFSNCATIGAYAFAYCSNLTSADFPNCTTIGSNTFYGCSKLTSVDFPNCTTIGSNTFYGCSKLTSVNFPNCTAIYTSAFRNCYALSEINFPKVVSIYGSVFYSCSSLTTVNFGTLKGMLSAGAFYNCKKLESINLANITNISTQAFYNCQSLSSISALSVSAIGTQAFATCSSLTSISLPALTSLLGSSAFSNCFTLESVYLLGTTIPTTVSTTPFVNTPLDNSTYLGYYGSIYVRESLLTSWQTKANISIYADRMVGLTDAQIAALDS